MMESEDRVVKRWWRRATTVRERDCDPKWEKVLAANKRLVAAERSILRVPKLQVKQWMN